MQEVVHADIFFFITAIAVMLLTATLIFISYYLIRILKDLAEVAARLRRVSEELERDFDELRSEIKDKGRKARAAFGLASRFISRITRPGASNKRPRKGEPA